jgi:hypothetical protein
MAKDILNMTDEEMLNMNIPPDVQEEPQNDSTSETDTSTSDADLDAAEDAVEDADTDSDSDDSESNEDTGDTDGEAGKETNEDTKQDSEKEELLDTKDSTESTSVDYKAEYERILAPFRANGKEIKVDSVDDAIALMMMGANYNKKMAGLKPVMKIVKMLENNGLMDESSLSYLIDLSKKNPDAIKKLVKESGIDPLEIDTENPTEYRPNTYTVNDNEVELDAVLDEIRDSASFKDTIDIISNKMDDSSKKVLLATPSLIKTINEHVATGIYAKISSVIESERMLGRLTGLSDLEAYKYVGDAIHARGGFDTKPNTQPNANVLTQPKVNVQQPDPKLKDRKKAASPSRTVTPTSVSSEFNPLSLSDEEFEKMSLSKFK